MIKMSRNILLIALVLLVTDSLSAQTVLGPEEYQTRKAAGTLPSEYVVDYPAQRPVSLADFPDQGGLRDDFSSCDCWVEPTSDYLTVDRGDDGSSPRINLGFPFRMYDRVDSVAFVNINGNISFRDSIRAYNASGFPMNGATMVAPFWADVDTRGIGDIHYKLTPTALYVNWVDVGYYDGKTNKTNSFQVIITDGNDPIIGVGNTVGFCYKKMEWTTGDVSQGSNGLGGIPATVGANRGNGLDYIQFGRFNRAGNGYDGPYNTNDGVDWLTGQSFVFTTAVSSRNIPPIVSSTFLCDTIVVCNNMVVHYDVTFLTPEQDQRIISAVVDAPTLPGYRQTHVDNGAQYTVNAEFIPTLEDVGYHTVTYTATDNGEPNLSTTVSIVLQVVYTEYVPPVITGDTVACPLDGVVLAASEGFDNYRWSNGFNDRRILVGPGTYTVEATIGQCILVSSSITIHALPAAETPVITGAGAVCDDDLVRLRTHIDYASYLWSTGSTDPEIEVGTGTYTVRVASEDGCEANSAPVEVRVSDIPSADFVRDIPDTVSVGTTGRYTHVNFTVPVTGWQWRINGESAGDDTTMVMIWDEPGRYEVTLTVTTAEGCTHTITMIQWVLPDDILVPNVFSPNGDGINDKWVIPGIEYYNDILLQVYNRWGQVIFESRNYRNTWAATDVADGTYYYVIRLSTGKEHKGHVTILR